MREIMLQYKYKTISKDEKVVINLRGEGHLGMNIAVGTVIAESCFLINRVAAPDWLKTGSEAFYRFMLDGGEVPLFLFVPMGVLLYLIGALLPDIDTQYSMLGRIIYIPVEHRTWTHAIWWPILFCIGGIWVRGFMWLAIGIFIHDLADSFSASGLNWFYPIKRKHKHVLKLYHTGHIGERVIIIVSWVIMILYTILVIQMVWHVFDKFLT